VRAGLHSGHKDGVFPGGTAKPATGSGTAQRTHGDTVPSFPNDAAILSENERIVNSISERFHFYSKKR
jgi:hypothetical protein